RVLTPNPTTIDLTLGVTVSCMLDQPADENLFPYTTLFRSRLYYDALDADNDSINVQLLSPSGVIPFVNGNSDSDVGLFTLTETGNYTITLQECGEMTGDYSVRRIEVNKLPARALTFDTTVN